ncbi:MAG: hypothetical protein QNJ65_12740 [Xenococcaceae cyanobacterium MO_234.B1]|nr:hypothetical protein [Xenococcaceae cyanobacterium MO_234.B1]
MEKVLIIVNAEVNEQGQLTSASPVTERMVKALKQGIINYSSETTVEITSAGALWSKISKSNGYETHTIYCPLTIQLPEYFNFPAKEIYQACKDITARRRWVERNLGIKTSVGDSWLGHLWLPVILNDKGIIYGEIIGEGEMPNSYEQPIELPNKHRQSLHHLASNLLDSLFAPPSVYLVQFSLYSNEIVFDRLWPFPAAPALASLRGQQPDLFSCHWLCLSQQPILDILISDNTMPIH